MPNYDIRRLAYEEVADYDDEQNVVGSHKVPYVYLTWHMEDGRDILDCFPFDDSISNEHLQELIDTRGREYIAVDFPTPPQDATEPIPLSDMLRSLRG